MINITCSEEDFVLEYWGNYPHVSEEEMIYIFQIIHGGCTEEQILADGLTNIIDGMLYRKKKGPYAEPEVKKPIKYFITETD